MHQPQDLALHVGMAMKAHMLRAKQPDHKLKSGSCDCRFTRGQCLPDFFM